MESNIEQWSIFELALDGPSDGNPFLDVTLRAEFRQQNRVLAPDGFYDGDGLYRVRFMPDTPGEWTYVTKSNVDALNGQTGSFICTPAGENNHGPVYVHNQFHFAYTDGTPFYSFGTTCYAWAHQGDALEEQTLETLKDAPFNKMRMCVFPKDYIYNENEPVYYPFERDENGVSDTTRFDPAFFRHFEQRVGDLLDLGIEADIIIFHPYDRWGYCEMHAESDYRYLRYLVARLAAYRNVWWSMANEYDFLLDAKPMSQWDQYFKIVQEKDPYQHLRSVHNGDPKMNYDHTKPWITHANVQNWDVKRTIEWRERYGKPIVNDECEYEGNIPRPWGNISGQELTHRFWITFVRGGYAGHGETYMHPDDILWWGKGGVLHGESWQRIAFMRAIFEELPPGGLEPMTGRWEWTRVSAGQAGDTRLLYFGEHQPVQWAIGLPMDDGDYEIDIIDTWNMTITPTTPGPLPASPPTRNHQVMQEAAFGVTLPGKPYLALRVRPRENAATA
ncbi:MAG: DUF5060 domain-containing protein [Caldilineaceae bacterium]|nr:DUF5060 domain-containing protein [Caldilineaceae bacterium]